MQSIETKYLGPTNHRGSRIKARSSGGHSVTISIDHALSTEQNHHRAAVALARKLGWKGKMVAGGHPSRGSGNVYVFIDKGNDVIDLGNWRRGTRRTTRARR